MLFLFSVPYICLAQMVQTLSCGITAVSDIWGSRLGAWNIYQPLLSPTALCGQGMPGHGSLSTIENHRSVPPPQMCNSEGPHLQSAGQICLVSEQVGLVKKTNVAKPIYGAMLGADFAGQHTHRRNRRGSLHEGDGGAPDAPAPSTARYPPTPSPYSEALTLALQRRPDVDAEPTRARLV